jgi:hypothetical protein
MNAVRAQYEQVEFEQIIDVLTATIEPLVQNQAIDRTPRRHLKEFQATRAVFVALAGQTPEPDDTKEWWGVRTTQAVETLHFAATLAGAHRKWSMVQMSQPFWLKATEIARTPGLFRPDKNSVTLRRLERKTLAKYTKMEVTNDFIMAWRN